MDAVRGTSACAFAVVIALSVGAVSGCGSDNKSSSSSSSSSSTGAAKPAAAAAGSDAAATAAGAAAGKAAGAPQKLPAGKKIGFLQIVAGIESADRVATDIEDASKKLGYSYTLCDAAGDPTKMATCASTLLSQGVDAIFTDIGDASTIASAMRQARSKNVPIIDVSGAAVGFDANYAPDEARLGKLLSDYVIKKLNALPDSSAPVAISAFPQPFAQERTKEFTTAIKSNPKVKVVATSSVDAANLIAGTKQSAKDQLTQNPNLKAFWVDFDTAGQAIGQQVKSQFGSKTFPDRPLVATFHGDLGTLKLMKLGAIDVVADVAYDTASWVGMDQLLELWTRKTPLSKDVGVTYPGVGDLYTYQIVDKSNLPPGGEYPKGKTDPISFFGAKWKTEFGV